MEVLGMANLVDVTNYTEDMLLVLFALKSGTDDDGAANRLSYKQASMVFRDAGVKMPAGWEHLFALDAPASDAGGMHYEAAILASQEEV
jgi:hypothetical protein